MKGNLLIEIGTEEIPASYLLPATGQFENMLKTLFEKNELYFENIKKGITPRRIALFFENIKLKQDDKEQVFTGPPISVAYKDGKPTQAAIGFAKSKGVKLDELFTIKKKKGEFIAVKKIVVGKSLNQIIMENLSSIILKISFPKSMRWWENKIRFARPIRWLLCLVNDEVIPFELGKLKADNKTYGHRVLAKEKPIIIETANWDLYTKKLKENGVIVDYNERKKIIKETILKKQKEIFLNFKEDLIDKDLLDEVTFICEYPSIGIGKFDEKYLKLPSEVLITSMAHHQKYFPIYKNNKSITNKFFFVFNNIDKYEDIISKGNEKVLKARLEDALFFYNEDLKIPFENRVELLKGMIYHKKLGTYFDKVKRIEHIALNLANILNIKNNYISDAALFSKADLTTQMVYEFPELQGTMGRIYTLAQNYPKELSIAIEEHYKPSFQGDSIPSTDLGMLISLADKFDTLIGFLGIGETPTGSKDPFALRRNALGIIHIIFEKKLDFDVDEIVEKNYKYFKDLKLSKEELKRSLKIFMLQRIENFLSKEKNYPIDLIRATFNENNGNFYNSYLKLMALYAYSKLSDFENLSVTFKRVGNIIKQASEKVPEWKKNLPDISLLKEEAEKELYFAIKELHSKVSELSKKENYEEILKHFSDLRPIVDNFFDNVMVMVEDVKLKVNRLNLLHKLEEILKSVADFTKIQMKK